MLWGGVEEGLPHATACRVRGQRPAACLMRTDGTDQGRGGAGEPQPAGCHQAGSRAALGLSGGATTDSQSEEGATKALRRHQEELRDRDMGIMEARGSVRQGPVTRGAGPKASRALGRQWRALLSCRHDTTRALPPHVATT